jgi:hypothetical protein
LSIFPLCLLEQKKKYSWNDTQQNRGGVECDKLPYIPLISGGRRQAFPVGQTDPVASAILLASHPKGVVSQQRKTPDVKRYRINFQKWLLLGFKEKTV